MTGFMTEEEKKHLDHLYSDFNKYWMPLTWFSNLASQAREEGRVKDDIALRLLMDVSISTADRRDDTLVDFTHYCLTLFLCHTGAK